MPDPGVTRDKPRLRKELRNAVREWEEALERSREIKVRIDQLRSDPLTAEAPYSKERRELDRLEEELDQIVGRRERFRDRVIEIVDMRPRLKDEAIAWGFKAELLGEESQPKDAAESGVYTGGKDERPAQGGGGGSTTSTDKEEKDKEKVKGRGTGSKGDSDLSNHRKLRNFKFFRLPSGRVVAIRTLDIAGNNLQWGVWVDKADFDKYGVKESDIRSLTKEQAKKLEVVGNADELLFSGDDEDEFKAIVRGITRSYKGVDQVLEDDELLGVIVAQSALNLTDNEVNGLLRDTKFYRNSTDHEQAFIGLTNEGRRELIRTTRADVLDLMEDLYGPEWQSHLGDDAMKQVRGWAIDIASGELGGDPIGGMALLKRRQRLRAREIVGTPAYVDWQQEQEADREYTNRPDEVFEQLRGEALLWLGPAANNTPLVSRSTLKGWASDIATGIASVGEWQQFLRNQMKTLHPNFDFNTPWQDQIDPFKAMLEQAIGTTTTYADPFLQNVQSLDPNNKPTGSTMSLYDYAQWVRDNDPRFWDNPQTEERVRAFGQETLQLMGVM